MRVAHTNRVAEMCAEAGIARPEFREVTGAAVVTFRVDVAGHGPRAESTGEVTGEVTPEVGRLLVVLAGMPRARKELQSALGLRHEEHFRSSYLGPALKRGLVEMTIPGKPKSRLQKYRLTAAGKAAHEMLKSK